MHALSKARGADFAIATKGRAIGTRWIGALLTLATLACVILVALLPGGAAGQGSVEFTDWTSVQDNTATGTLRSKQITLSGTVVDPPPSSTLDGTSPLFSSGAFTPPLPQSDAIQIRGFPNYSYTLNFGPGATDPVLHLFSLASTLTFPSGTSVSKVSGDPGFNASGNTVVGSTDGQTDANGTVRLNGPFTSISFTAEPVQPLPSPDGIVVQVGEPVPAPPPPVELALPTNVTPPSIRETETAGTYICDPGTWNDATSFTYRWILYYGANQARRIAETQTFRPRGGSYGYQVGCTVTATGPGGTAEARSTRVVFSSAGMNKLPPAYGDVRIRGIDLFQTVQPNKGAKMFGYSQPGTFAPSFCGGGTPTNFVTGLGSCVASGGSQTVAYSGVRLDRFKEATAMVYVDVAGASAGDPNLRYLLELIATRDGRAIEPPVHHYWVKNPPRSDTPFVTLDERDNTSGDDTNNHAIPVLLPSAWTSQAGSIRIEAKLHFPEGTRGTSGYGHRQCEDATCRENDTFTLTDIPFVDFPEVRITTLELSRQTATPPQRALRRPDAVLARALEIFPGGSEMVVEPYSTALDITEDTDRTATAVPSTNPQQFTCGRFTGETVTTRNCRSGYVTGQISGWTARFPPRSNATGGVFGAGSVVRNYDLLFGVHDYDDSPGGNNEPGWASVQPRHIGSVSSTEPRDGSVAPYFTANQTDRPLTAAAHELAHALTAPHAGHDCPVTYDPANPANGNLTGPGTGGNEGQPWNDDDIGRLQSTKFDGRPLFAPGGIWIQQASVTSDTASGNARMLDLMSYCSGLTDTSNFDGDVWLSAYNWNRIQEELAAFAERMRRPANVSMADAIGRVAATATPSYAYGVAGPTGGDILRVVPVQPAARAPLAVPDSPFKLRSLGPGGQVLLEVGVRVTPPADAQPDDPGSFVGPVAAGASAVELVRDGVEQIDRMAESQAPTVRVTSPRRGARVRRRLTVRWRASDPDGHPLSATIDYSPDGRYWQTIYDGPSDGSQTLPGSYLSGSKRGRVRVSVNDGFTERSATSKPFVAFGRRPAVRILAPTDPARIRAGERVLLEGRATDDLGRPIRGSRLTWFAGKRRLGRGVRLRARIARGTKRIRLVARDRTGKSGIARLRTRVEVPRITVLEVSAPDIVRRGARTMKVRIRASAPGTLRVAGRRFGVGTRARAISVRLPRRPAVGIIEVPFRLKARGANARGSARGVFSTSRT